MPAVKHLRIILCLLFCVSFAPLLADGPETRNRSGGWPQWLGPERNGKSAETNLALPWPSTGPNILWRTSLGEGYSGISVSGNRVFTMYDKGEEEFLICLDFNSGKVLWELKTDQRFISNWGNGPRVTPTIDEEIAYTVSGRSKLYAVHVGDGSILWQRDLVRNFGGEAPDLGYSNSPLVDGDKLWVVAGGRNQNAILALDKRNGKLRFSSQSDHSGYSSPILTQIAGQQQLIFFTGTKISGVSPINGTVLWEYPWKTSSYENVATPVPVGSNQLFFSSAHAEVSGSALLQISRDAEGKFSVEKRWGNNEMKNHFSTTILYDGYLYGTDRSILKCLDVKTGVMQWQQRGYGEGTLMFVDGYLLVMGTRGKLGIVKANPNRYQELATKNILKGKSYTVPSLADGRLLIRDTREIVCIDLRKTR